jgi:Ca2+-binding RTX toxin-like protein
MAFQPSSVFSLIPSDGKFLLRQLGAINLKIVGYSASKQPLYGYTDSNNKVTVLGELGSFNAIDVLGQDARSPLGLRTFSGVYNNLKPGRETWGAANVDFLRSTKSNSFNYLSQNVNNAAFDPGRFGPGSPGFQASFQTAANGQTIANGVANSSALYENAFKTVVDYTPRMISQTIASQAALDRLGIATAVDNSLGTNIGYIPSRRDSDINGQSQSGGSGIFAMFGQYFDHGLDFINKGGNVTNGQSAKVVIPLSPSDPLYDPAKGVTSITISRATVADPNKAGADRSYINRTSAYADLGQVYGSDQQINQMLREWVADPNNPGKYIAGAGMFNGQSLKNAWEFVQADGSSTLTKETVTTLKELRAHLLATGRDDLSWGDLQNLRVRDSQGRVLDADPNQAGIQSINTDQPFLLDANPHLDASRIYQNGSSPDSTGVLAGVVLGSTLDARGFPTTITVGGVANSLSKYINVNSFSIQPNLTAGDQAIATELLLRSVGDHYMGGDGRLNENFGLTTMHHVFQMEHEYQLNNIQSLLLRQQSQDPTKSIASWQTEVKSKNGAPLSQGVRIVNGHYEDAKGNYVTANGSISWNQEKLFEAARLVTQTEYQHITVEYARFVSPDIAKFQTYKTDVNAGISLEYSQAAFRFGHSQLRETIDLLDPNGSLTGEVQKFALKLAFLNPKAYAENGPGSVVSGMARQISNEIDEFITPALQQTLLGQPLDLVAINIARGRDVGLPTLNQTRKQLRDSLAAEKAAGSSLHTKLKVEDLNPYSSWNEFKNNMIHPESLVDFIAAYSFDGDLAKAQAIVDLSSGKISQGSAAAKGFTKSQASSFLSGGDQGFQKIDLWIGGLAEKHVSGGQLGTTFNTIFVDQMERLQDGDRFYYLFRIDSDFQEAYGILSQIESQSFKDMIERTTGARHLQGDVFEYVGNHIELGETAQSNAKTEHKYGGLTAVKQQNIGVRSIDGTSTNNNGSIVTFEGKQYVLDVRPSQGTNANGSTSSGFNADEVIGGTNNNDYIEGGNGGNTIYGEGGNDILSGGNSADFLYGGVGNDILKGGNGDDLLNGGIGNDVIYGGAGMDKLVGEAGNDTFYGEAGDDEIFGGEGNDSAYLGTGIDKFIGGEGFDIAYLNGKQSDYQVSFSDNATSNEVSWVLKDKNGINGDAILIDVEQISVTSSSNQLIDSDSDKSGSGSSNKGSSEKGNSVSNWTVVFGGDGNDTLVASSSNWMLMSGGIGNDTLTGGVGNDTLAGGVGNDTLNGGQGDDGLLGGDGNDMLVGGVGKDTLTGGVGVDTFRYTNLNESLLANFDVITDYTSGDIIDGPGQLAMTLNKSAGKAAGLSQSQIQQFLTNSIFGEKVNALAFTVEGQIGTFVALNNGQSGFQAASDALLFLQNYTIGSANKVSIV